MAEEGKSEGQSEKQEGPWDAGQEVLNEEQQAFLESTEYLSSHPISTYEEMKAQNTAQSQRGAMEWQKAVSKDERAQNARHVQAPTSRHFSPNYMSRKDKARHAERQQTQRDIQALRRHPHASDVPYAKGEGQGFLDWMAKSLEKAWKLFSG